MSTAHGSPAQRQRRRPGASAERSTASKVYDVEDDDEDLAAATTTATDSVGYWVCVLGIFFLFLINSSVLSALCPLC